MQGSLQGSMMGYCLCRRGFFRGLDRVGGIFSFNFSCGSVSLFCVGHVVRRTGSSIR